MIFNHIDAAVKHSTACYKAGMQAGMDRELLAFIQEKICEIQTCCDDQELVVKTAQEIYEKVTAALDILPR